MFVDGGGCDRATKVIIVSRTSGKHPGTVGWLTKYPK